MLGRLELTGSDPGEPDPKDAVFADRPVATDASAENDVDPELLATLAKQRGLVGLSRLDLAARQLPATGERGRCRPLRSKHPIARHDRCADHHLPAVVHGGAVCHAGALTPGRVSDDGIEMPQLLSPDELSTALGALDGWSGDSSQIRRSVKAPSFAAGIRLVDAVAEIADGMDHHPDIDIRWTTITFACSTHSEGGVTDLDVTLARRIDDLADGFTQA